MPRNSLEIEYLPISLLRDNKRSARRHSKPKVRQLAASIQRLGFNVPIIINGAGEILAGHARAAAARLAGMEEVPVVRVSHLTELEARAFMLAENKFALNAFWDFEVLAGELQELVDVSFDTIITGFDTAEIDLTLGNAEDAKATRSKSTLLENMVPHVRAATVSRPGDLWVLGRHKLLCGDARDALCFSQLMGSDKADIVFTDPPYNVKINGHVSGLGKNKHLEFAMASGEMSEQEFTDFLKLTLGLTAQQCRDGAAAFVCMDWRHMGEVLAAGKQTFSSLMNICVWNKHAGGMGSLYRSKHEMVLVFKNGTAPHTNNVQLGASGRNRTNVWDYAGVNSMSRTRAEDLAMHPTVKPVALVVDALKDCSHRGEIVLDPFGGSGTTLIAAERCGRSARVIEFEPHYCDTIIARYEKVTGKRATLQATGEPFGDLAEPRREAEAGEAA